MSENKKSFFYVPTWILMLICIFCLGGTIVFLLVLFNIESFGSITSNGVVLSKGSQEYTAALKTMKQWLGAAAVFDFLLVITAGWFSYKRIKNK